MSEEIWFGVFEDRTGEPTAFFKKEEHAKIWAWSEKEEGKQCSIARMKFSSAPAEVSRTQNPVAGAAESKPTKGV